jgi:hypothetical protein
MIQDVKELKGYLAALLKANPQYGAAGLRGARDGKFKKRAKRYNPITMKYLAIAWGVGVNFPKQLLETFRVEPKEADLNATQLCTIECLEAAKIQYTAKKLFMQSQVHAGMCAEEVFAYGSALRAERRHILTEESKADWLLLGNQSLL